MITEKEFAEAVNSRSRAPIYEKMKAAHVGIAGLGGLGSNIATALARSGIGHLTLVDFDTVELSNINRQAYTIAQIGKPKTEALCEIIRSINPFCVITTHNLRVDESSCAALFADCGIVCEAFDGAESKSMLVNTLLAANKTTKIISGNGMAGFGRANEIVTKKLSERLYVCGDFSTDVADGEGLTAARVIICAGHQASKVCELILNN
ncbi:MAG: sulfur carrier protein ThiS adenylyltransferase ThiF [Oscillospiraceae bacterium]